MIKFSSSHIKKKIGFELLDRAYGIRGDEAMSAALTELTGSENEDGPCFYEFENVLPYFFDFNFEWVGIPIDIVEEQGDGYNYWLHCAFCIPELIPYTQHSNFDKIAEDLFHVSVVGGWYSGNCIELVYLPKSNFVDEVDPAYRDFGNQPGTFILGVQDNGGLREDEIIEFLSLLRSFNETVNEIINREERK